MTVLLSYRVKYLRRIFFQYWKWILLWYFRSYWKMIIDDQLKSLKKLFRNRNSWVWTSRCIRLRYSNNFPIIVNGKYFRKMQLCVLLLDACRRHTAEFVWTLSNANLDIIIRYVSLRIELQSAAPTMHNGWISVILFKNLWLLTMWLQVVKYFV